MSDVSEDLQITQQGPDEAAEPVERAAWERPSLSRLSASSAESTLLGAGSDNAVYS
jgi:hypothetical protein